MHMDEFHETHYGEGSESYFQHDEHLENTNYSQFMHTQGRERGKWVVNVIGTLYFTALNLSCIQIQMN